ncbi:GNAT family N-acetyltransferase [Candidatus Poribacteria bacterium]|nr:GNAT family N-acetyltransferase [Candidatus Poribacteria bacterium]
MTNQTSGTIRLSTDNDKTRIHEIAVAAWRPIFGRYRLIVGDEMWNDLWSGWDKNWFTNANGIVTELDGQIVGFATWYWPIAEVLAEVGGNAVDPKFQGRGIGSAQIRWLIDKFREWGYKCAKVHTGMDPAHGPARAEYRNAGLRRGVTNSRYFNYLNEVARVPTRSLLSFRWAESDDAELVRQMTRSAWNSVYKSVRDTLGDEIFDITFKNAREQKTENFAKVTSDTPEKVRIVMEDEYPAGFTILDADLNKRLGEINALAVTPEFRGRGIGCALCMDAFDIFRERGLRYTSLDANLGEVNKRTRQMCWNAGLYRELPSIDYYMML